MKCRMYIEYLGLLVLSAMACEIHAKKAKAESTSMVGSSIMHTMNYTELQRTGENRTRSAKTSSSSSSSSETVLQGRNSVETRTWTNEENCGKARMSRFGNEPRIVGGKASTRGEWPWQAMLLRYYSSVGDFSPACGGTLIKPQWVLTASHCFDGEDTSYTHIALGATWKNLTESSAKRFAVAAVICHEAYLGADNAYKDDVCLVKLAAPVTYTRFIIPGCLPAEGQTVSTNELCTITGWGETQGTGSNAILQKADVRIISRPTCSSWYGILGVALPPNHFCAGYQLGGIDSCQGDSGGPLVCQRTVSKSTSYMTFGIVSFGIGCAEKERPGVYADVASYRTWIQDAISRSTTTDDCFSKPTLIACGSTINQSGTIVRTPVDSEETWLYPPDTRCSWELEGPVGSTIRLEFMCFFHVEIDANDASRCYDYMKIEATDLRVIYCGTKLLTPVDIASNKAILSFHSDSSVQSSGFVVRVVFVGVTTRNYIGINGTISELTNSTGDLSHSNIIHNSTCAGVSVFRHRSDNFFYCTIIIALILLFF